MKLRKLTVYCPEKWQRLEIMNLLIQMNEKFCFGAVEYIKEGRYNTLVYAQSLGWDFLKIQNDSIVFEEFMNDYRHKRKK